MAHEIRILCEGYYDRAFWKGWLEALGAKSAYEPRQPPPLDLDKKPIRGGHFGFYSKKFRNLIRVQPCGGRANLMPALHEVINLSKTNCVGQIIVNIDSDKDAAAAGPAGLTGASEMAMLKSLYPTAQIDDHKLRVSLPGHGIFADLVVWESAGEPHPGVPGKQTLERLVCRAMCNAFPDRAEAVGKWLASRPAPPPPNPKEHAWSYMAGWYADCGSDAFFERLWRQPAEAAELQQLLRGTSAAALVSAIVES